MIIHARSSEDECDSGSDPDEENLREATVSISRESAGSAHDSYPMEPSSDIELRPSPYQTTGR
jgi:hypothetical protein